jgi:hypothetical protein
MSSSKKRFPVSGDIYDRAREYLRPDRGSRIFPARLRCRGRSGPLIAYALYGRMQMGDRDAAQARKLLAESGCRENLSLENDWLVCWQFCRGTKRFASSRSNSFRGILEKPRLPKRRQRAHFVLLSYQDDDHLILNSDQRADASYSRSARRRPAANDLMPKSVRGLFGESHPGPLVSNTQENVFCSAGVDSTRYFKTTKKSRRYFVGERPWLGNAFARKNRIHRTFRSESTAL